MKKFLLPLALAAAAPGALGAQDTPPPLMAEREIARSQRCVPAIARFVQLQQELEPFYQRAGRIQGLNVAITLEDSVRAAPFDLNDPVELAVRDWFVADHEMALQYVASRDESILQRREDARTRLRERLQEAMDPLASEVESRILASDGATEAAEECEEVIFVRSAVLEACQSTESPVCEDARVAEPRGRFAFVESPADLWDVEELRPWSEPAQLHRSPDGLLAGSRTAARSRRGNLILSLGIEPMIRARTLLSAEEMAEMDANLDSLGFVFEDARYAMSPVLTIQLNLTEPIGGETHYVLHFGDLSDPLNDVIWTAPAGGGGAVEAVFAPPGWVLNALAAGEAVSFTAVKVVQEGVEAEAVFVLGVTPVGQGRTIAALLEYMKSGQLGRDLMALVPEGGEVPPGGTPPPGQTAPGGVPGAAPPPEGAIPGQPPLRR